MTDNMKKSLKIASVFVSSGLMISFLIFFLLFGKGLQILVPLMLFCLFFIIFFLLEKIPFISRRPVIKAIIAAGFIIAVIIII